jgi:4,5-DOPA dioxygenase extradiol
MYPQADVPVVQLSIDGRRAPAEHRAIGKLLAPLRDEGVLVLGSGGIVHNLGRVDWTNAAPVPAWAQAFDDWVQSRVAAGDDAALEDWNHGPSGRLAVPTPDHFLPLLYVLGTRASGEAARVVHTGYELGSISLTALQVG